MHNKQWFLKRIGKTIKRERIDLETGRTAISYRYLAGEREALDCYATQDQYHKFMEKERPIMHGYKSAMVEFMSNVYEK